MMLAFLMHLGSNMWRKKGDPAGKDPDEDFIFREQLCCDPDIWRKVTDFLPSCGINTLLIDVADGVRLDSHPEIAVEGAWTKAELRAELARLRAMGITPIPKCNFSFAHSAWLKEYAYTIGTETYDRVCREIVEEIIELFDAPEFFHLGLEEENYEAQRSHRIAIVRGPEKKAEDARMLFETCLAKGVRPWIWGNWETVESFGGPEAFQAQVPKEVLISGYYYEAIRDLPEIETKVPIARFFLECAQWGYEQVPTGSTWSWHLANKDIMRFCKGRVSGESIRGYMSAPWLLTIPSKIYGLYNDAFNIGNAKKDIYGEELQ